MAKKATKSKLHRVTDQSMKIGDKFSKLAIENTNLPAAHAANRAYANAIKSIRTLLLYKAAK